MDVYLLWHTNTSPDGTEDDKLLGVFSTEAKAKEVLERALEQPGFKDNPDGFEIGRYDLDKREWCEGYV